MNTQAPKPESNIFEKIANIDRRIIYLVVAIVLVLPYFVSLPDEMKRVVVDPRTQDCYDEVERLGEANRSPGKDKFAVVDIMWDPSVQAECWPQTEAMLEHLMRLRIPTAVMSFRPEGVAYGYKLMEIITERFKKAMEFNPAPSWAREIVYGVDWVHWGYIVEDLPVYRAMAANLFSIVTKDERGTPIRELPIMADKNGLEDCGLVFQSAGSAAFTPWLFYICPDLGLPLVYGCTAIMGPELIPFYSSGQMKGLMDGMKGAAEYEQLLEDAALVDLVPQMVNVSYDGRDARIAELENSEDAAAVQAGLVSHKAYMDEYLQKGVFGMVAQNMAHLWIIVAVVLGNIGYLVTRRRKRREMGIG
jgi:hypothetical protein